MYDIRPWPTCTGATPVQYYTSFFEHAKRIGFNEVNMTQFKAGTPDPAAFELPRRVGGVCDDTVCQTYAANIERGMHPIHAFTDWVRR